MKGSGAAGELDPDRLGLGVLVHGLDAVLPAEAGKTVPAERHVRADHPVGVDPHRAGAQRVRHPVAAVDVLGPDLPPSSSSTPVMFAAAAAATFDSTAVDPVNAILSMSGCAARALPTAGPNPVTTLNTPGGNPASSISAASSTAEAGE